MNIDKKFDYHKPTADGFEPLSPLGHVVVEEGLS